MFYFIFFSFIFIFTYQFPYYYNDTEKLCKEKNRKEDIYKPQCLNILLINNKDQKKFTKMPLFSKITDNLYLGNEIDAENYDLLTYYNISYIVNAVTDWMRNNLTYDYNNYINGYENDRDASVIAAMEDGIANDEGYAAVFDMFFLEGLLDGFLGSFELFVGFFKAISGEVFELFVAFWIYVHEASFFDFDADAAHLQTVC